MSKIIGIDLGTTNSVVAVMEGGEPVVIPNAEGNRTTPSVVAFTEKGERLVGQVAKRQAITNPENTVFSIKRFMGRRYNEVAEEMKMVPYEVVEGGNERCAASQSRARTYSPPEISAMILQKLKKAAEDYLGEKVERRRSSPCPPTSTTASARRPRTPARSPASRSSASSTSRPPRRWPTGSTRRRTRRSPSSTSAAARSTSRSSRSATACSRCKATNGDTHLGGDDFDQRIIDWIVDEFQQGAGHRPAQGPDGPAAAQGGRREGQVELSSAAETDDQPAVHHGRRSRARSTCTMKLTRAKFEQLVRRPDRAHRSDPCRPGTQGRRAEAGDIDEVMLVGGSTRIPRVQEMVQRASSARSRTRASTRTRSWPSARRSRAACWPARSRTCCCST